MTENMKNLDEEIAQQIKNDHIKKMVFTARNYSLEDVETIVCGNLNTIAYEYEKALSALRASWEREKANLEAELADHKKNHNTAKWSEVLSKRMDQIAVLEKEKAGLEERVKIIEQDRDSWRRCAERLETEKTEPKLTINIEESAIKELFKNQAEELTRLKSRNEELEAEKSKLEERVKFLERGLSGAEYLWQEKVDRLTASLAAAQESLRKIYEMPFSSGCGDEQRIAQEALSDPSGSVAFEKWKKMGAVVEAARACYEEDDFITENSPGSFERDKKLGEALEALDAKGEGNV